MTRYITRVLGTACQIRCRDCGRWVHVSTGGVVVHSSRCEHAADRTLHLPGDESACVDGAEVVPAARGPVAPATKPLDSREPDTRLGRCAGMDEKEIINHVRAGLVSMSDAMNRDD